RARLHGDFECADCNLRAKPGESAAPRRNARVRLVAYSRVVPRGGAQRTARNSAWRNIFDEVLAFLAALVSAPVFSFLLCRAGEACAPGESRLAGRQADCFRLLAYGSASSAAARTIFDASAK